MKAALVLDQFADISALTESQQALIIWRAVKGRQEAIFPIGTIFEGDDALRLCKTGQAQPFDDECAEACGMNAQQLASAQLEYKMNSLGINRREDRELFRAGVIAGYDGNLNYIPGPNWGKYQQAKKQIAKQEDEI